MLTETHPATDSQSGNNRVNLPAVKIALPVTVTAFAARVDWAFAGRSANRQ